MLQGGGRQGSSWQGAQEIPLRMQENREGKEVTRPPRLIPSSLSAGGWDTNPTRSSPVQAGKAQRHQGSTNINTGCASAHLSLNDGFAIRRRDPDPAMGGRCHPQPYQDPPI